MADNITASITDPSRAALADIAALNITPDTGASVALRMRDIAYNALNAMRHSDPLPPTLNSGAVGPRDALRGVCKAGGDLGCSCADQNYQWFDHACRDDDCEDQACPPTDHCTKFKCDNAELVLRGKYWCCPNCGASYGEYPFHGGVAGEPVAWLYEMAHYIKPSDPEPFKDWKRVVTLTPPPTIPKDGVRKIVPLYALPPVPGNEGR